MKYADTACAGTNTLIYSVAGLQLQYFTEAMRMEMPNRSIKLCWENVFQV